MELATYVTRLAPATRSAGDRCLRIPLRGPAGGASGRQVARPPLLRPARKRGRARAPRVGGGAAGAHVAPRGQQRQGPHLRVAAMPRHRTAISDRSSTSSRRARSRLRHARRARPLHDVPVGHGHALRPRQRATGSRAGDLLATTERPGRPRRCRGEVPGNGAGPPRRPCRRVSRPSAAATSPASGCRRRRPAPPARPEARGTAGSWCRCRR